MPTTEPLDPGDDAEGQLKPIAEFKTPSPGPVLRTPAPQPAPPATRPSTVQPAQPATHFKTTLRTPGVGLRSTPPPPPNNRVAPAKGERAPRTSPFTPGDLAREWQRFIDSNGAEHLLVNAMRAAMPKHVSDSTFAVTQSEVHIALIREHLDRLTAYLRNALDNDNVTLRLNIVSEDSPLAWNDREFINHVIADNPGLARFIDILKLSLI